MSDTVNVARLQKPQAAVAIIKRAHQYIQTMRDLRKPVERVTVRAGDYDSILRSINSVREEPATGLHIDGVRLERGAK